MTRPHESIKTHTVYASQKARRLAVGLNMTIPQQTVTHLTLIRRNNCESSKISVCGAASFRG
jgi:hypothetical protein